MVNLPVISATIVSGAETRQGEFLTIKVLKPLPGGLWQVSFKGRPISARSEIPLKPGQLLRARAVKIPGGMALQILEKGPPSGDTPPRTTQPYHSPQSSVTNMIVQVLQRSGVRPEAAALKKAHAVMSRMKRRDATVVGVIGALMAKGLEPGAGMVESVLDLLAGDPSGHGHEHRGKRRGKENHTGSSASIDDQIRAQIKGTTDRGNLLHLFNHKKAPHGNWIVIPYRVVHKDDEISGTIRLRTDGDLNISRVVLDTDAGRSHATFSLSWPHRAAAGIDLHGADREFLSMLMRHRKRLGEKLGNLNLIFDDNRREGEVERFAQYALESGIDEFA